MNIDFIIRHRLSLLLLVVAFLSDMVFRLWLPVSVSSQSNQIVVATSFPAARQVPPQLLDFYQSNQQEAVVTEGPAEQIPVDAKQIGNYVVALFGIYSQGGHYKAILRVQPDPDAGKRLRRVGLGSLNADLTLTALSAETLTVGSTNQTITLQLFNKKQLKKAAE